ncbi:extracellular solute-binding protein [Haploplasma axanthum]|uniref:Putrescine-binding periplasmic protein n=1 Tax=Haploplasma axanthum TaxID=29552 RepID=A0A449BDV1_HAPAX|nr:extracellular solute-binding protein [Haploplasma axanthum]VEU80608.1 Putrescine-binding periplasmic protein precursor [Haploplasma axanthum]
MKKILSLIVVVTTALVLVACSNKPRLIIYLPNEYIDMSVIKKFEKENNVRVRIINFDSNEVALGQVKSNSYDVVIPSDYAIEELAAQGLLEELNTSEYLGEGFENAPGLEAFLNQLNDEGFNFSKYAIPYFWGNVGVLYNHNITGLTERVKTEGFGVIGDQNLETIIYESSRDAYMVALNVNDVLLKDATKTDIDNATQWLINAKGPKTSILSDQILTTMLRGTKYDAVITYSGDAAYIMSENENYSFYAPANTNVWADGFVIPKNATNKELAKEFIKYMTSYEAAFDNSSYVGYSSPRKDVYDEMIAEDGEYGDERLRVAYAAKVTPFQFFRYDSNLKKMLDDGWEIVVTA